MSEPRPLDLSDRDDDEVVSGYTAPAGALRAQQELKRKLGLPDQLHDVSGQLTDSALIHEHGWRQTNRGAPKQDPRLRSGSAADQHRLAVAAALRDGGFIELPAGTLNRVAGSIPMGGNVAAAVHELGLPKRQVRTRSAETVLRRRI